MSLTKITIVGPPNIECNFRLLAGQSFYKIDNIKELMSSLGTRRSGVPKQAAHGEDGSLSHYGPRLLPFEGEIHAQTETLRITMEQNLRKALRLSRAQSYGGDDGYRQLLIEDEDGTDKLIYAKVVDMPTFTPFRERWSWASSFRFTMIAEDPFIYAQSLTNESGIESVETTGLTLIEGSLPTLIEGSLPQLIETISYSLTVTSNGTEDTPPVITLNGPTDSPVITNETTGVVMDLDGLVLTAGERIEIDVETHTITKFDASENETIVTGYLTEASDWIFVDPGENNITLLDDTPGELDATLEFSFRDNWV